MLILVHNSDGGFTARTVRVWARVRTRLRASHLDHDLASGTPPEASAPLAVRAQVLVGMTVRRGLAGSVHSIVSRATPPSNRRRVGVPLCVDRVMAASGELGALRDRLLDPVPVSAQGVARAYRLLGDGHGPLYNRECTDDLGDTVRHVLDALDPFRAWD